MKVILLTGRAGCGKDTTADMLVRDLGYVKYSFAKPLKTLTRDLFGFTEIQVYGSEKEVVISTTPVTLITQHRILKHFMSQMGSLYPLSIPTEVVLEFDRVFRPYRKFAWTWRNVKTVVLSPNTGQIQYSYKISPRKALQLLGTEVFRTYIPDAWIRLANKYYLDLKDAESMADTFYAGMVVADCRFENEALWGRSIGATIIHIQKDDIKLSMDNPNHVSENPVKIAVEDVTLMNNNTLEKLNERLLKIVRGKYDECCD